jgi:CHAT domain
MNRSTPRIKILFLSANPIDTNRLRLDEEVREITQKIRSSKHRDVLELVSVWAVRPDDLLQALNEHQPHFVHFSGHGSPTGEIFLIDELGRSKPVSEKALQFLFKSLMDNIRVVILNACYSRKQAKTIVNSIDCVIGMSEAISDVAAIFFATSFYRAIGFGRSVKEAFEQGIAALLLQGCISEENIPELLIKPGIDAAQIYLVGEEASEDFLSSNVQLLDARLDTNDSPYQELTENGENKIRYRGENWR